MSSLRAQALVLGSFGIAETIAKRLQLQGFSATVVGPGLPLPSDPDGAAELQALLSDFCERAGEAPSSDAHCIHPGVSTWADRPELAQMGQALGLNVLAPPVRLMSLFANQLNLIGEAEKLGIPHLVLGMDPIYSVREIEKLILAPNRKLPVVLKSVKAAGGYGLFVIHHPSDLEKKVPLWLEQIRKNLGEVILFAERYLEGARFCVQPFARFSNGRFESFPVTDASLQTHYRPMAEFCPAPNLSLELEAQIREWTEKLAAKTGFVGVGSAKFLVDNSKAYFLGGCARLEENFPLWEKVAGTDAVAWQLAALEGGAGTPMPQRIPRKEWSHAVSLNLFAEDTLLQLPQPGLVHEVSETREWDFPSPHFAAAELMLSVKPGMGVDPSGDGMIGSLVVGGKDRKQVITVARGILDELWISGTLQTNERFLSELVNHPWVREGIYHASFIEEEFVPAIRPSADLMGFFASVGAEAVGPEIPSSVKWAVGDQWIKPDQASLKWVGRPRKFELQGLPGVAGTLELVDGSKVRVAAVPVLPGRWQIRIGLWVLAVRAVGMPGPARQKGRRQLLALVPGRVHAILFRDQALVPAHEPAIIIESLRKLVPHALPIDVRVLKWKVKPEEWIQTGQELAELGPTD